MTRILTVRFLRALRRLETVGDLKSLLSQFSEDAWIISQPGVARGRAGIEDFWTRYSLLFRSGRTRCTHVIESGGSVAIEWKTQGELIVGQPINAQGVVLLEFKRNKISRMRAYFHSSLDQEVLRRLWMQLAPGAGIFCHRAN